MTSDEKRDSTGRYGYGEPSRSMASTPISFRVAVPPEYRGFAGGHPFVRGGVWLGNVFARYAAMLATTGQVATEHVGNDSLIVWVDAAGSTQSRVWPPSARLRHHILGLEHREHHGRVVDHLACNRRCAHCRDGVLVRRLKLVPDDGSSKQRGRSG